MSTHVALDPPFVAGTAVAAAICRTRCRVASRGVVGDKRPVAILVFARGKCLAIALDGTPLDRTEIETLCPGAFADFEAGLARLRPELR